MSIEHPPYPPHSEVDPSTAYGTVNESRLEMANRRLMECNMHLSELRNRLGMMRNRMIGDQPEESPTVQHLKSSPAHGNVGAYENALDEMEATLREIAELMMQLERV